jgi:MFS family permease
LVLLIAAFGVSFYPLLTALTRTPLLLPLWAGIAGFFVGGVDLVFFDIVLSTCPPENQASYVGIYQTTVQVATFLAPLVGTAFSDAFGIVPALILATVLRFAGAALLARLGVGRTL